MKFVPLLVCVLIAASTPSALAQDATNAEAPAPVQPPATWTEPDGRFTLSFRDLGYLAVPPERAAAVGNMLIIARNDSRPDQRMRVCALTRRPPHEVSGGQTRANGFLDQITADDVQQNVGQPVTNLTHGRIGDVATMDYVVTLHGNQMYTRDFVLATPSTMTVFDITCGAPSPMSDEETASFTAVLNTLAITPSAPATPAPAAHPTARRRQS